nr:WGR domain-containing protein [uncultured Cohaesibacter sp.]
MHRFYHLTIEPDLLGGVRLIRCWGRIGTSGQVKGEYFSNIGAAQSRYRSIEARKIAKGYTPVTAV